MKFKPEHAGMTVGVIAGLLVILSLSKCAVDSYKAQAEHRLAPSAPTLTAVEVSRHGEPVPVLPRNMKVVVDPDRLASERMYRKLNADMASGRRAPNKMGAYEKDEGGWTVIQGPPPFDPKPEAQATTFTPEEAPAFDPGVVGQDFIPDARDIIAMIPPGYYGGGGGGYIIETCPECCADLPTKPGTVTSVPEPSAVYLLGTGLIALIFAKRKKI